MSRLLKVALLVVAGALLYVAVSMFWPTPAGAATGMGTGPELQSIGPIAFGADGTLFVADNRAASIFASTPRRSGAARIGSRLSDSVAEKVAAMLGTDGASITITDMAVHPATRNVFLSVARNGLTGGTPAVFRHDAGNRAVSLEQVSFSRVTLPNPPRGLMGRGARVDTVTDMRSSMAGCGWPVERRVQFEAAGDPVSVHHSRGVMKIPADAFGSAPAITEPVTAVRAGVRYESIESMKGVDQLDLLDQDRAVIVARRDDAGVDLRIVSLP